MKETIKESENKNTKYSQQNCNNDQCIYFNYSKDCGRVCDIVAGKIAIK